MQVLLTATTDSSSLDLAQEATKKLNAFQRFWQKIDWDSLSLVIIEKSLYLILLLIIFLLFSRIGKRIINHAYKTYLQRSNLSESRAKTIHTIIRNLFQYTLYFFFIYAFLSIIGVPVGSLLAGAGILGVAIGLGAQGFMNDIITGFFILLEKQMDVGDYIQLSNLNIEGTVISVGIRTVQVKSSNGTLHFIPNRNITTISNLSRGNMQVIVDVRINPEEDVKKCTTLIEELNLNLAATYQEVIQTGPTLFGLVDLGNSNFALRTIMYVTNGQQHLIKETFLAAYVKELTAAGFTIPNTPIAKI
ncbi:small-conductance mechanosensitive channel [Enterococcus sp. PF1-24]|nr:small-conductance mechanosensitive channel [Enterococcus sp. PFB1-1]MDH6400121.1 small-conductance mechanosensitive channel [Enterococcus sp. PF1-24]